MFNEINSLPSILIVDDNPENLHSLNEAVKDLGNVYFAKNGAAALEISQSCKPDIILLDIEMPFLSGYEVLEELKTKKEFEHTSVIFVTGHSDQDYEIKALELGGVDFIQKPINLSITRARVKTQLDLRSHRLRVQRYADDMALLVHNLPAFIAYWDDNLINIFCNDELGNWFGMSAQSMKGRHLKEIVSQDVYQKLTHSIELAMEGQNSTIDIPCGSADRSSIYGQVTIVPRHSEGTIPGFLMLISDITSRKIAEQALVDEKERIKITLNSIGDAVIAVDKNGFVTFLNPIAEDMTGWLSRDAEGQPIETVMPLKDGETGQVLRNPIRIALEEERIVGMALNCILTRGEGHRIEVEDSAAPIRNHLGEITGAIIVFHDVSEARAMALKMTHLAQHDVLTNLPNRLLLRDRAHQALQKSQRSKNKVGLILFDIDHFKNVNETVGHEQGDRLIKKIADELLLILRKEDTLCRQGGDEFIVLLSDIGSSIEATRFINRIFDVFSREWVIDNIRFNLSISLGAAVYPDDSEDLDELYRHADAALFSAKQNGRNQYQFYGKEIGAKLFLKHQLESALKSEKSKSSFQVYYQPKIDIINGVISGVEALVRWYQSDGSIVSPAEFIPLAEETGLIIPLGKHIFEQACKQGAAWRDAGFPLRIAVNISVVQFEEPDFVSFVKSTIEKYAMNPALIELEITESVLAKDANLAITTIELLRSLGFNIALDDFGTGYSSLSYITEFPLDVLKIDQRFVRNMLDSARDKAIVAAIIQMAKGLELRLVAEGVETEEHLSHLKAMGCQIMQGFLFSKAITGSDITALLSTGDIPGLH
tara:strand:- start:308 stop:2779 length:2472 start_codon:yes stop_codon:yes gene_type:complete